MEPIDSRKKRHRPDGPHPSSPLSKRLYILDDARLDSSFLSNKRTAPCSCSSVKVDDRLICRKCTRAAVGSQSSISSVRGSELSSTLVGMTSAEFYLEAATRERTKPFRGGKGNASESICLGPSNSDLSDENVEVSEVTFERPRIVNSSAGSTTTDYEPIAESGFSRYRGTQNIGWINRKLQARPGNNELRHKVGRGRAHEQPYFLSRQIETNQGQRRARYITEPCSSIADETGSFCGEPTEDLLFEEKRLKYTNTGAYRADRETCILGITGGFQSAGFSDLRNKSSTSLHVISRGMKKSSFQCEGIPEIRSSDSTKAEVLHELEWEGEIGTLRMGEQERSSGHASDEDASKAPIFDKENEDIPRPSYVLSSGRLSLEQEAQLGRRAPTIDRDFEEYFSGLML